VHDEVRPGGVQASRDGGTDPAGATGDHYDFIFQCSAHRSPIGAAPGGRASCAF
jgi:hypothetical protein